MYLKINSEISDLSGGVAYAFAVHGNIDNEDDFISTTLNEITNNEWDYESYTIKMIPDILPDNVATDINIEIHEALSMDKLSLTPLNDVNQVNVFIYARDFRGNHNITAFNSNPIHI
jgi:hypothetical protein